MRTLLFVVFLFAAGTATAGAASPTTIGYRGNPSHDSRITGAPAPPLGQLWATDLGAPMSYPVVAEGLVFVSVRNNPGYGTQLVALDATTGARRWQVDNPGTYWVGGMAYDAGRLYVLSGNADLRALAPQTGAVLWSVKVGQTAPMSPPVAFDGKVYTDHSGSLIVTDGATGATLWTKQVPGGGGGAPAVDQDRIYVSGACRWVDVYQRATGAELWHNQTDCSGGSDYTPVVSGNRLWPLGDNPAIYDTASGAVVGNASFQGAIGVGEGAAYAPLNGAVLGVDAGTWATRWTFGATDNGSEAPLVGDTTVYVQNAQGATIGLDRATGAPTWCAPAVNATNIDDHADSHMGAGDGRLFVPSGTFLVAYGKGGTAPPACDGIGSPPRPKVRSSASGPTTRSSSTAAPPASRAGWPARRRPTSRSRRTPGPSTTAGGP